MRDQTEKGVKSMMAMGRSVKKRLSMTLQSSCWGDRKLWEHGGVATVALQAAVDELDSFPRVSDAGANLSTQAKYVLRVRGALLEASWGAAASWAPLAAALEEQVGQRASHLACRETREEGGECSPPRSSRALSRWLLARAIR